MDITEANERADLALMWLDDGRAEDALGALDEIVTAFPDVDRFVFRRGMAAERLGQLDLALSDFRQAIRMHPSFGIFHHALIRFLIAHRGNETALADYQEVVRDNPDLNPEILRFLAQEVLVAGCDPALVLRFLPDQFGPHCQSVHESGPDQLPAGTIRVSYGPNGFDLLACPFALRRRILVARLFAMVPYLNRMATLNTTSHPVLIALDDLPPDGDDPVLCFSGFKQNHLLIPDALFLESDGYRDLRHAIDARWVPWEKRQSRAYWRGALTGVAWDEEAVNRLPRVALTRLAQKIPNLDARITDLQQFSQIWPGLAPRLDGEGLLGPREPEIANIENQILIDVDGNSNAWSGFFLKLLCGSPTIKLMSQFRQWYYARLVQGIHFIPISDLEGDLANSIDWLLNHPAQAEAIGKAARQLALSMTTDSEFSAFQEAFEQAQTMAKVGNETDPPIASASAGTVGNTHTMQIAEAFAHVLGRLREGVHNSPIIKRYSQSNPVAEDIATSLGQDLEHGHLVWVEDVWGSKWPRASEAVFSCCILRTPCEAAVLASYGTDLILCKPADHADLSDRLYDAARNGGFLVSRLALFGWNTVRVSRVGSGSTAS